MLNDELRIVQMIVIQLISNVMNAMLKASVGYHLPHSSYDILCHIKDRNKVSTVQLMILKGLLNPFDKFN